MLVAVKGGYNRLYNGGLVAVLVGALLGECVGDRIGVTVFNRINYVLACKDEVSLRKRSKVGFKRVLIDKGKGVKRRLDNVCKGLLKLRGKVAVLVNLACISAKIYNEMCCVIALTDSADNILDCRLILGCGLLPVPTLKAAYAYRDL